MLRLLASAAAPAVVGRAHAAPIVRATLTFALARAGLELARVDERFESASGLYRLSSEARAVGLAAALARGQAWRRESSGTVADGALRPELFLDQRGNRPTQRARFEWSAGRIVFDRLSPAGGEDAASEAPLPDGAVDRLSFPYALALRPRLPEEWQVPITDGRRLATYRCRLIGPEPLQVPAGRFDTVHVARVHDRGEPATDVWVARAPAPVPIRIRITEPDGTAFDQVLVGLDLA